MYSHYITRLFFNLVIIFFISISTAVKIKAAVLNNDVKKITEQAYEKLQQGEYKASYLLAQKAKELATEKNNIDQLARALNILASNYLYIGNFEKSLAFYNESLRLSEQTNNAENIDAALNNIANIYVGLEDYKGALTYRTKQYELTLKENSLRNQLIALHGLSVIHLSLDNVDKAKQYLTMSFDLLKKSPEEFLELYLITQEADILSYEKAYDKAIEKLKFALEMAESNNYLSAATIIKSNMVKQFLKSNQFDLAEKQAKDNIKLSQKQNILVDLLENYKMLIKIAEAKNDYKKALHFTNLTNELESQFKNEKIRTLAEITKVEFDLKEVKSQLEKSIKEKQVAELKIKTHRQQTLVGIAFIVLIILILSFIYYRRTSQQQLKHQKMLNDELKELDKLKDRILANTSHELRTPLNGIIGMTEVILMQHENEIDADLKNSVKLIAKSGKQLSSIINDILDLAQLKSGKIKFNYSSFNLPKLIKEVVQLCQALSHNKKITMDFYCEQDLSEIYHDKKRVQQILYNLIGNAVKFTDEGSITVNACYQQTNIYVEIIDTGIGVPESKIDKIFEGFEQVDANNNRKNTGSGLGLAICRELIHAMQGEIKMVSKLNHGTTVSFSVPIVVSNADN